jgi:VanZ family protein
MMLHRFWWALGFLLVGAAVYVCLLPPDDIPRPFALSDKVNHLLGHAALAAYFSGLVAPRSRWTIFAGLLLMGVGIEIAQNLMHVGRQSDVRDVLANCCGAALGLLLGWIGLSRWPLWADMLLGRRSTS